MRILCADFEVFEYDWVFVSKVKGTDLYTVIHNDKNKLVEHLKNEYSDFCFMNGKGYDKHIANGINADFDNQELKRLSDFIIEGGDGWDYPGLKGKYFKFNNMDIMDDMQQGVSLKSIEAHLGMNIEETQVDFDIKRPLTAEELKKTIYYCKKDVDATEIVLDLRKDYINNKLFLGRMKGIPDVKTLSYTNAKLTCVFMDAVRKEHYDERDYVIPDKVKQEYIPKKMLDFFNDIHDLTIPSDEYFHRKCVFKIGECEVSAGFGGIHGAISNFMYEEKGKGPEDFIIRNFDVGSYYPWLMILFHYISRNIPDPNRFINVVKTRMEAKAAGDKKKANALKLIINTMFGILLAAYEGNAMYDPLQGRSVCITGQLFLTELAMHLFGDIKDLSIIQLNTDGIMIRFKRKDYQRVLDYVKEWTTRTGFTMEEDKIEAIYQKDVNNYIMIPEGGPYDKDGKPRWKIKGGYLVRGVSKAGAFNINNNAPIVSEAIIRFFVDKKEPRDTINECNEPLKFQIIAKGSSKFPVVYQLVNGEKVIVQKVNRVYATPDEMYGKLYKIKKENGAVYEIPSLPDHCFVDNKNVATIEDVDKEYYIQEAQSKIGDFLGLDRKTKSRQKQRAFLKEVAENKISKEEYSMEEQKVLQNAIGGVSEGDPIEKMLQEKDSLNVYQKLLIARNLLARETVTKSGLNSDVGFEYFELKDIVPKVNRIFTKLGLLALTTFTSESAIMEIVDVAAPDGRSITFTSPMKEFSGNRAMNPVQALGAVETYQRRYLYMVALDICEPDQLDSMSREQMKASNSNAEAANSPSAASSAPKGNSTNGGNKGVTAAEINGLKTILLAGMKSGKFTEEEIGEIAVSTRGFKEFTRTQFEEYMKKYSK